MRLPLGKAQRTLTSGTLRGNVFLVAGCECCGGTPALLLVKAKALSVERAPQIYPSPSYCTTSWIAVAGLVYEPDVPVTLIV